ncbi:hypothetical protein V7968_31450 [Nocardia vulneris]|uniref:hypothetical protein n=1 Tax=Nocardia vulneris TaxID=1141657 RepID=UPI0030CD152F
MQQSQPRAEADESSQWPIASYLTEIDALSDGNLIPVDGLDSVQTGTHLFPGRSHTEIVRIIAMFHEWRVSGDQLAAPDGMVVAPNLESAGIAMAAMGWFLADGSAICWQQFCQDEPPSTRTYPNAFAIRQWLINHSTGCLGGR